MTSAAASRPNRTHRRAGAAARRAAGSAADNRRELSDVALMTADDIGVRGDGKEHGVGDKVASRPGGWWYNNKRKSKCY